MAVLGSIVTLLVMLAASASAAADRPVVLENVTLIDGTGVPPRPGTTVVVDDGKIMSIQQGELRRKPANAKVVDLRGAYLLPGLIDGHIHLARSSDPGGWLESLLYSGVTSVREMAGDATVSSRLAAASRSGEIAAPNIYYSATFYGPSFLQDPRSREGIGSYAPGAAPWKRVVQDDSDIAAVVREARATGATGIKLYSEFSPGLSRRIVEEAHRQGLKVWSHASIFPSRPTDAVAAGVDVIVHNGLLFPESQPRLPPNYHVAVRQWMPRQDFGSADPAGPAFQSLFAEMVQRGTIYEPTLAGSERFQSTGGGSTLGRIDWDTMRIWGCEATRAAHRAGVRISAGTDTAAAAPVQREMELLVECGLSPMEAIVAATRNNALGLGIEDTHGTVEAGKVADLLVVSADPTRDIANIRKVVLVMKGGKIHREEAAK